MDATPQKQGSARVPEVVPTDGGEASAPEERLKVAVDWILGLLFRPAATEIRDFVYYHVPRPLGDDLCVSRLRG